jgi:hypothetical protein
MKTQKEDSDVIIAIDITSIIAAQQESLIEQDRQIILEIKISELNQAAQATLIERYQEQGLAQAFVTRGETWLIADNTPDGKDSDEQAQHEKKLSGNVKFEALKNIDLENNHFDKDQKSPTKDKDSILDKLDDNSKAEIKRITNLLAKQHMKQHMKQDHKHLTEKQQTSKSPKSKNSKERGL